MGIRVVQAESSRLHEGGIGHQVAREDASVVLWWSDRVLGGLNGSDQVQAIGGTRWKGTVRTAQGLLWGSEERRYIIADWGCNRRWGRAMVRD